MFRGNRNKLIAQIFYDMGLIERYGSGIHRILEACRDANLSQPVLENFSGGFRIKFVQAEKEEATESSNVPLNVPLNKKILGLVKEKPGIQRKDLAEKLDVTEKTIGRAISKLAEAKKIEHRGSKKTGGYWPL